MHDLPAWHWKAKKELAMLHPSEGKYGFKKINLYKSAVFLSCFSCIKIITPDKFLPSALKYSHFLRLEPYELYELTLKLFPSRAETEYSAILVQDIDLPVQCRSLSCKGTHIGYVRHPFSIFTRASHHYIPNFLK